MAAPEEVNADMLAFWNGNGGHTWVARQMEVLGRLLRRKSIAGARI